MNDFTWLFLAVLALSTGIHLWLDRRQWRHVLAHRDRVPDAFAGKVSEESHRKAADYTVAKLRLGMVEQLLGAALLLLWTLGGGLELLDRLWLGTDLGPVATGTGFLISMLLVAAILDLPLSAYRQFVIEERFGFNRMSPAIFAADTLKGGMLLLVIGTPLAALVLWLMGHAGDLWWLWVWAVLMAFMLLLNWAFPNVIAPLFNKFSPLADQALAERIERLLARCGFASKGVFVVDGSRRSAHGNAYFTGIGNSKRIVFFDTLLAHLDHDEIEAVLAHELGHFRRKHILKGFALTALISLAGLAILGWLMREPWFYQGLGVSTPSLWTGLGLFMLVLPTFMFFMQPWFAAYSRRHEFEADDFAAEHASAQDLIRALVKLYNENAKTLTPDRLYSAFHESHPPAPERVAHLSAKLP